jgi:general secretion pathway protein K
MKRPQLRITQRGVAVVTALLLTTLAVTIVASLFWQQQVQVRSIENQRLQLQKQWILRGALDWARLILREDARTGRTDNLTEPWAVPLQETRLDQYVEEGQADADAGNAALSGSIIDAQSRFNLGNLVINGAPNVRDVAAFSRLLDNLDLPPDLARATANLMIAAQKPDPQNPDAPWPVDIRYVEDLLAVPGFTDEIFEKIKDYVIVLPNNNGQRTTVNINTAPAEVIAAVIDSLTLSDAVALVERRKQAYFNDITDIQTIHPDVAPEQDRISVSSDYFIVNGDVRLNRASLQVRSLIARKPQNQVVWIREN